MAALKVGEAKVKLRTANVRAEIEGTFAGCIEYLFRFVPVADERGKILARLTALHVDMLKAEALKAEAARVAKKAGTP